MWRNTWTAIAYADGKFYDDVKYELEIVDRLGGGDSFSAGFIYGRLMKDSYQAAVRYGIAFSALKHSMPSDFNWATSGGGGKPAQRFQPARGAVKGRCQVPGVRC